jgi:hypothetical protein
VDLDCAGRTQLETNLEAIADGSTGRRSIFWRESATVFDAAIPGYRGPCWFTMDPASLLDTSYFNVTWVGGEFWHAPGKVTIATCGEAILEQEKC